MKQLATGRKSTSTKPKLQVFRIKAVRYYVVLNMRALRMFYVITPRQNIVFNTIKEQYGPAKTRPYTRISNIRFVIGFGTVLELNGT
jgi:hypothetical protein